MCWRAEEVVEYLPPINPNPREGRKRVQVGSELHSKQMHLPSSLQVLFPLLLSLSIPCQSSSSSTYVPLPPDTYPLSSPDRTLFILSPAPFSSSRRPALLFLIEIVAKNVLVDGSSSSSSSTPPPPPPPVCVEVMSPIPVGACMTPTNGRVKVLVFNCLPDGVPTNWRVSVGGEDAYVTTTVLPRVQESEDDGSRTTTTTEHQFQQSHSYEFVSGFDAESFNYGPLKKVFERRVESAKTACEMCKTVGAPCERLSLGEEDDENENDEAAAAAAAAAALDAASSSSSSSSSSDQQRLRSVFFSRPPSPYVNGSQYHWLYTYVFGSLRGGLFVESGAADIRSSVTDPFERFSCWTGLGLEPIADWAKSNAEQRTNMLSLRGALCPTAGTRRGFVVSKDDPHLSGFKAAFVDGGGNEGGKDGEFVVDVDESDERQGERSGGGGKEDDGGHGHGHGHGHDDDDDVVVCHRPSALLTGLGISRVDLFVLDCEGCELAVLRDYLAFPATGAARRDGDFGDGDGGEDSIPQRRVPVDVWVIEGNDHVGVLSSMEADGTHDLAACIGEKDMVFLRKGGEPWDRWRTNVGATAFDGRPEERCELLFGKKEDGRGVHNEL